MQDSKKSNRPNQRNTFGTFDWSEVSRNSDNIEKPKNVTSDMWTPIISPSDEGARRASSVLRDEEKYVSKKKHTSQRQPQGKKGSAQVGSKKASAQKRVGGSKQRNDPRKEPPKKKQSSTPERKKREEPKNTSGKRTSNYSTQRERKAERGAQRSYEKSQRMFNEQMTAGSSREEISKKRAKKTRRSKSFYVAITVCAVVIVAAIATVIGCFVVGSPIEKITVDGKTKYSSEEIVSKCGVAVGDNIFAVNRKKLKSSVISALPYIHDVEVNIKLPGVLKLKAVPANEKYYIATKKNYICIDVEDKILSTKKKKASAGKYIFEGFKGQEVAVGEKYVPSEEDEKRYEIGKRIVSCLDKLKLEKANVIKLSSLNGIVAVYDSRFNILIGSSENLEKKLEIASKVVKASVTKTNIGYIDVRYDGCAYFDEGVTAPRK